MKKSVKDILYNLNQIEVHGEMNLNLLLGAIQECNRLMEKLENEKGGSEDAGTGK